jgi:HisJ family histidinol phosphate phosphatase
MIANYHTHTRWCRHGSGEIEDYIREAIAQGLEELAFTGHVPQPGDPDYSRMAYREFPDFNDELNRLIRNYEGRIRIRKGMECEYYPDQLDYYRDLRDNFGYEIFVLGHHTSIDRSVDNFYISRPKEAALYAKEVCEALETGFFTFLAHPDIPICGYGRPDGPFLDSMARIFQACERLRIPVEINANGLLNRRGYPCPQVWELARNYDLDCLINSDAHHVQDLVSDSVAQCEALAEKLGLRIVQKLP